MSKEKFKRIPLFLFNNSWITLIVSCSNVLPKGNNSTPIKIVRFVIFSCSVSLTYTALFTVFKKLIIDTPTRYGNK